MPGGRPSKYKEEFAELAYKYCLLGAKDAELATFFEVDEATINRWKIKHTEFCESLKRGKEEADATIADSLFHRARGYSHTETKVFQHQGSLITYDVIKHYPPDPTSMIFWLKNRQPKRWRDKQDIEHGGKVELEPTLKWLEVNDRAKPGI